MLTHIKLKKRLEEQKIQYLYTKKKKHIHIKMEIVIL